jgi:hypothetical protein
MGSRQLRHARALLWPVAFLALGCEWRPINLEDEPLPVDAGDGGTDASLRVPVWTGRPGDRCDPVAQSCGGQRCAPDCALGVYGCAPRHPESRGTQDIVCGHDEDCAPGFVCISSTRGGNGTRCTRYCKAQTDCPAGTRCVAAEVHCTGGAVDFIPRYLCLAR